MMWKANKTLLWVVVVATLVSGCKFRQWMYDNGRVKPLEENCFFSDCRSARPLIEGTVAQGHLMDDTLLHEGTENGRPATRFPFPIGEEELASGRTNFEVFCSVCHGYAGYGNGMVVQRGFKKPPSFHIERLQNATPGYFYAAIKNGFGAMPAYRTMIPVEERWHIVAYLKALQLSQDAKAGDVPEGADFEGGEQ